MPSSGARPIKYLVLGALVNDDGDVVETVAEHLHRSPARAGDIGRELGAELGKLHQARCAEGFGNFADSPGADRRYRTWSSYLEDFFRQHRDYVGGLGIPDHQIEEVGEFIRQCRYVDEPRYLHGDVSIRNIAIHGHDPVRISLFDPNPLCGDPSWDLAPLTNNAEYSVRRYLADGGSTETLTRDRELLAGFWETYPHVVGEESLLTAQLVQAVLQAEHRQEVAETDDADVTVTQEFIRDAIDRMSA